MATSAKKKDWALDIQDTVLKMGPKRNMIKEEYRTDYRKVVSIYFMLKKKTKLKTPQGSEFS